MNRNLGPLVFAHRGASGDHLENTLAAFQAATDCGVDGVELDVMVSADSVPIVFHDDDLTRLAGRATRVDSLTWVELQQVSLRGGQRIPSLEQVLVVWPATRWLNVELKAGGAGMVRSVARLLTGRPNVILSSFAPELLAAALEHAPEHERAMLLEADSPVWLYDEGIERFACRAVHVHEQVCTRERVAEFHQRELVVGAWTVNSEARARELVTWGVDRIFTDWPARLHMGGVCVTDPNHAPTSAPRA